MTLPRPAVALLGASALAASLAFAACGSSSSSSSSTPATAPASPPVQRTLLGAQPNPIGAHGETLGLSRVVIQPGATIALHYHPGTQVAYVDAGTLTYTVRRGLVNVMAGTFPAQRLVRHIGAGQSGTIQTGQWIVEYPTAIHTAHNGGSVPVVVLLSTLLTNGAPPAVPVH